MCNQGPPHIPGSCPSPIDAAQVFDEINKAKHYNVHPSGVEAIEIVEHLGFCLGNAIKYLFRVDHKDGVKDLKKAVYYLRRAHVGDVDHRRPPQVFLDRVTRNEPKGQVLGDVLRALYWPRDGVNWYGRVAEACKRVEQEIERRG